ncbi:galactoside alpha-(1,2)-fucosyltransferase 2-like isoform X1 [Haliotis rufescens]|uniref:galactoside alpha-(1,2)-fucosyltransferase 2-like isoform X1 n=2 Tax=Haliotis rufescens TaxID=6454 RepID=UPI00201E82B1|nr:galactoside alpha-(1,2)-fucosyltransferase 2-like isoform X1 [Haliotis rufescens]
MYLESTLNRILYTWKITGLPPMAVISNKGLKFFLLVCLLLVCLFMWQFARGVDHSIFIREGRYTEHRDVIREHIVQDVEIDRRSIVLAARELLKGRETEEQPQRHVICPNFNGGLGNMLFQYASAYGISRRVGLDILVKADAEVFQVFDVWAKVSSEKTVCPKAKIIKEKHSGVYEHSLMSIRNNADYVAKGYLQSWKYFEPFKVEIRKQLRFRGDIERKAFDILDSSLSEKYGKRNYSSRTLVGVHVRRGNLMNKHEREYGYKVATPGYIKKALAFFTDKYRHVTFVVCSNDMKWSRNYVNVTDVIYVEGNPREVDLALLSSLNHTILTVGTFGWWSAWMANGTTLFFKDYAKNGTRFAKEFSPDHSDYLYPGWIGM